MGYVSLPYRVVYEASSFRSGLTDIRALVLKPDLSVSGPYAMTEMPSAFRGRYFFDFITSASDPEGEYVTMIVSPSENIQTTIRLSLYARLVTQLGFNQAISVINAELEEITDQVNFITASVI